jgi:hypothetical protein
MAKSEVKPAPAATAATSKTGVNSGAPNNAPLKHYEQVTQAMALKSDRRAAGPLVARRKKKPNRSMNPGEVTIPPDLKGDEKDRLLQELKVLYHWQKTTYRDS